MPVARNFPESLVKQSRGGTQVAHPGPAKLRPNLCAGARDRPSQALFLYLVNPISIEAAATMVQAETLLL